MEDKLFDIALLADYDVVETDRGPQAQNVVVK